MPPPRRADEPIKFLQTPQHSCFSSIWREFEIAIFTISVPPDPIFPLTFNFQYLNRFHSGNTGGFRKHQGRQGAPLVLA